MLRRQAIAAFRPRPVLETRLRGPSGAPRPRARPNSPRERPLPSANMTLLPAPWALARSHPRTMARTPVAWPMALPPSLILHSFTSTVNAHRWCTSSFTLSLRRRGVTLTFLFFFFSSLPPPRYFLPRYFNPATSISTRPHAPIPDASQDRQFLLPPTVLSIVQRIDETRFEKRSKILERLPSSSRSCRYAAIVLTDLYFIPIDLEQQNVL